MPSEHSGEWYLPNTFPDLPEGTNFQAAAWLGDTLYVHCPSGSDPSAIIRKYSIGGTWTLCSPLPAALVGGTLTKCGNKLYFIGGSLTGFSGTGSKQIYEYTPSNGQWVTKTQAPANLVCHGAVSWGDSVIFAMGGPYYTMATTNLNVYYYRPSSDTWGTISNSLPNGRRSFGIGISGNKIVIAGGYNTAFLKTVYIGEIGANASSLTWHAGPAIPTNYTGISRAGGVGIGSYFFLVCGERAGLPGYSDTTHVMNVDSETWIDIIDKKPMKTSNICNGVAAKIFGDTIKLFVPGGFGTATGLTPGAVVPTFDVLRIANLIALPVELVSFSGKCRENKVLLSWKTATEINNYGFEIERRVNNGLWQKIGFVSGSGNSYSIKEYSFYDQTYIENNHCFFRLKQIDFNGNSKYSGTIELNSTPQSCFLFQNYPNPFNPATNINYTITSGGQVLIKVLNMLGQEVAVLVNEYKEAGSYTTEFSADKYKLGSGIYFYSIESGNYKSTRKMILNK